MGLRGEFTTAAKGFYDPETREWYQILDADGNVPEQQAIITPLTPPSEAYSPPIITPLTPPTAAYAPAIITPLTPPTAAYAPAIITPLTPPIVVPPLSTNNETISGANTGGVIGNVNTTNTTTGPNNTSLRASKFDAGRDTGNFLHNAGVTAEVRYVQTMDGKTMAIMPTKSGSILLSTEDLTDGLTALSNRGDSSSSYFANAIKGLENLTSKQKEQLPLIDPTDGGYNVATSALIKAGTASNDAVRQQQQSDISARPVVTTPMQP